MKNEKDYAIINCFWIFIYQKHFSDLNLAKFIMIIQKYTKI
jgi:hypothetical protein